MKTLKIKLEEKEVEIQYSIKLLSKTYYTTNIDAINQNNQILGIDLYEIISQFEGELDKLPITQASNDYSIINILEGSTDYFTITAQYLINKDQNKFDIFNFSSFPDKDIRNHLLVGLDLCNIESVEDAERVLKENGLNNGKIIIEDE